MMENIDKHGGGLTPFCWVQEARKQRNDMDVAQSEQHEAGAPPSPWLTVREAAARARCGAKLIYREVTAKRLQAARVGGRRELRFRAEWIDDWLLTHCVIK